jgi:glutamate racemase
MKRDSNSPIGVFDSGVGGLTVLRALREMLPEEDFLYLGDTARVPYGPKGAETVTRYSFECAEYLIARGAKLVVGACNTASSIAGELLERELSVPFIGTVKPSVNLLARSNVRSPLWVLGTTGTIKSGAYQAHLKVVLPDLVVQCRPCPLLVPIIEEGFTSGAIVEPVLDLYLSEIRAGAAVGVLLACTHYPLLRDSILRYFTEGKYPPPQVMDCAEAVALAVKSTLVEEGLQSSRSSGTIECLLTDMTAQRIPMIAMILGDQDARLSQVSLAERTAG